ncbi:RNA 2',3'-cyclic phosphodiesterase [Acidihalobacter ferrooxydans]|uniref:RNA 2',3'-cyclic phosphodiesterase n=1 Tax=Acidihalobacter ferrooxydans TaxID=1765967 RepID=A0A1P8UEI5_9GAMM|nr:RNA 2',3'-cyclic phosphodiesterase [Acidihalobacter ferrooxydans]APZ42240.1 2'-5' RNA ligase [Acidihalobacter ferrooxydans]
MKTVEPRVRRLFFAALPDRETRAGLATVLRALPDGIGRPVAVENLHMTLVFVGAVNERCAYCVRDRADQVPRFHVDVSLDRLGCFREAGALWLGPTATPQRLLEMAGGLNLLLKHCGIALDRDDFRPHVTLARKVYDVPAHDSFRPVVWRSSGFSLMESISSPRGVRYRSVQYYGVPR